jgi:predicted component of type VI protein secretion system
MRRRVPARGTRPFAIFSTCSTIAPSRCCFVRGRRTTPWWRTSRAEDHLYEHLLDLVGMGSGGLQNRLPIRDEAVAFYSGLLSVRSRPADGLARLVGDYFDVPATVEQFVGEWRRLESGGQCALGEEGNAGRLGASSATCGILRVRAR